VSGLFSSGTAGLVERAEEWRWGSLWRWLKKPEPGPEPKRLSSWPIARLPDWIGRVNEPLTARELNAVRRCAQRDAPLGDEGRVEAIARRLNLESTMRPRGRSRVRFPADESNKEA
jgi:putative transposase